MIRTNFYLEEQVYKDLHKLAYKEHKSLSEVTRDILKEGIKKRQQIDTSGKKTLLAIANLKFKGGDDPYLSENVDHYLYGAPKKETMKDPLKIFVDTDAFVALAREDDANHEKAILLLNQFIERSVTFITSNYVFSESITVISARKGHEAAVQFIHTMQSPENYYLLKRTDEALEEEAIDIFKEQTSKNTSFVDCTNMAFMSYLSIDAIFSFDRVYKTNGFILLEEFLKNKEEQAA